jgi:hypothetical protein
MGFIGEIWRQDALAKARGEPTKGFHNIVPNPNNPEIAAIYAAQKKVQTPKAPPKVEKKQEPIKAEPASQMEGRVATVNRKKQSRGTTIMDPLQKNDERSTYRKKLLGD